MFLVVHDVGNRMSIHRVAQVVLHAAEPEPWRSSFPAANTLPSKIETSARSSSFCGCAVRTVALEAKLVRTAGAQQVFVVSAVRLVAGCATLVECRLMQMRFLHLIGLIAVASKASLHRVRLSESWTLAGVRIVARRQSP